MALVLELEMPLKETSICMKMVLEMVAGMVPELQMPSGMPSESNLIEWVWLFCGDTHCSIGSSSPVFAVFLFGTDVIAVME
jgi:hypothetical protein